MRRGVITATLVYSLGYWMQNLRDAVRSAAAHADLSQGKRGTNYRRAARRGAQRDAAAACTDRHTQRKICETETAQDYRGGKRLGPDRETPRRRPPGESRREQKRGESSAPIER